MAVDLVDLGRLGVDLGTNPRRGLVDQIDRLVGQKAVSDVAVAERRRGDKRGVLDSDSVVDLVALLEPTEDGDRILDGRLADEHRLEAALERGVLLDVLAILVERSRTDRAQLAASEHRLEQIGGVNGALGGTGADDRVQLIDEQDNRALGVRDLLEHRLEAVLELAAVLRAGDQGANIKRDHAPVLEAAGDVAIDDSLCEALGDRRLADAGLANQDRVVLGPAGEDLDHAPDLIVAPDHGVELALGRGLGQVATEALERLKLLLRGLVGDAVRAADLRDRLQQFLACRTTGAQRLPGPARMRREREQQVLRRHIIVAQRAGLVLSRAQDLDKLTGAGGQLGRPRPRVSGQPRQPVKRGSRCLAHDARLDTELAQYGNNDARIGFQQHREQMLGSCLRVAARIGQPLRGLERLLGLNRKAIGLHMASVGCEI